MVSAPSLALTSLITYAILHSRVVVSDRHCLEGQDKGQVEGDQRDRHTRIVKGVMEVFVLQRLSCLLIRVLYALPQASCRSNTLDRG